MDFFVDPDRLSSSGRAMADAGARAAYDLGRPHRDIAAGAATPWAPDASVDALYRELSALTGAALDLVSATLQHGGAGLQAMADAYARVEGAVGDGFGRIAEGLRGPP